MTRTFRLTACLMVAQPGAAQDLIVYSGAALEYEVEPDGAGSENATTLSSYIELESAGFYGGLYGAVANDRINDEINLYAGYRRDLDSGLSYDLSYTRYIYPNNDPSNYGELGVIVGQSVGDAAAVALELYYDHTNALASGYVVAEYYPADRFTLSANFGVYEQKDAPTENEWDIGVTYGLTDEVAVDLRYYDGSDYTDGYVGLELTFDTTLFGG